ncbi:MAG: CaiB/BaiF CoA transferase family protein [Flavobacteriaceae bacterium]
MSERTGPLAGLRMVEFAGIGPAPFGAMLMADLGAEIIRIDRPGGYPPPDPSLDFENMGATAIFNRGRRTVRIDIKSDAGRAAVMRLVAGADALIEGYRPGTMERLGFGPEACLAANPHLVYARMTGWGQEGPLARSAGHDLNYIGVSGALSLFGVGGDLMPGLPPLIGDMGGGGLFMAFGILAAIIEARSSGKGQVVDAAIVDGAASLYALVKGLHKAGVHPGPAGTNALDGGRWFYRTYRCADGRHVAVGAIEPAFRRALLKGLGLAADPDFSGDTDDAHCTDQLMEIFESRSRDEWSVLFEGTDACVTPVLSMDEAETSAHATARESFVTVAGVVQHAPSPRFSRTPGKVAVSAAEGSRDDPSALADWGLSDDELSALRAAGAIS